MTLPTPDPAFRWATEACGPALRCSRLDAVAQHLFTSKQLKLQPQMTGPHGPQLTQITTPGWTAAAAALGAAADRVIRVKQVHGNVVRVLKRGRVAADAHLERPDGDAVVANEPGLVLAVAVADCVPILLADAASGSAAAVHAGWRGTCARVVSAAVECMVRECGATAEDLTAAIGPSIGPADYEVGDSVVDAFRQSGHTQADIDRWFSRGVGKPRLDLWSANRDQLKEAGVRADRIFTCGLSTLAHPGVFDSFRREGEGAGRMAALIVVPEKKGAPGAGRPNVVA